MRYELIEGFDHYPAISGVPCSFDSDWNNITGGPFEFALGLGGENQSIGFSSGFSVGKAIHTVNDGSILTFHFAINVNSRTSNSIAEFLNFYTAGFSHQFGLGMDLAGHIQLWGEGGLVVATGEIPLNVNQTYRCCGRANVATGEFHLSVNGDVDAGFGATYDINDDPTSTSVGIVGIGQMADGFGGRFIDYHLDDLLVGMDEMVEWGPLEINTLPASADILAQFTRSAGVTNFSCVDDLPCNGDTDYNSGATVGLKDIFDYADPPHTPDSILVVQLMTLARKEESAVRKFKELAHIGGVDYLGNEHNLAETYGRFVTNWPLNPATSVPWTPTDLAAFQGGYLLSEVD